MQASHAIGIDFGGTKIEVIVIDGSGAECWRKRLPTPAGYADRIAVAKALVETAERELAIRGASVGVGAPGTATADGRIKNSNSVCLNGMPLAADLAAALGRPVRVANDANCLALSEATDGAAAGAGVVFAAILGTGVGAGIVVHGRILEGPNGLAGEWGHNPLPWADAAEAAAAPACYCGQRGCIETWLSGPGLAADHMRHAAPATLAIDGPEIVRRAAAGDAACAATLERHAARLARALAHVINLIDPDVIVLGGGLSRIDSLYQRVPALWGAHVFSGGVREPVRTRLAPAKHGDSSGVRGAAWLFR
jgi:fructokinase